MKARYSKFKNKLDVLLNFYEDRLFGFGWAVLCFLVLFSIGTAVLSYNKEVKNRTLAMAIERAKTAGNLIKTVRHIYSDAAFGTKKSSTSDINHGYGDQTKGELPLPVEILRAIDQNLAPMKIRVNLHSPFSSFWSNDSSGIKDETILRAWSLFFRGQEKEFLVYDQRLGVTRTRYFLPDLMAQSCIDCHSQMTTRRKLSSTMTKMEVGDVAGIIEVDLEVIEKDAAIDSEKTFDFFFNYFLRDSIFIVLISVIFFTLAFVRNCLRKRLTDLQNWDDRNRSAVNYAPNAMITVDANGYILDVNPATSQIFGYTSDEMVGQPLGILMPPPVDRLYRTYLATYLKERNPKIIGKGRELTAKKKDGMLFPIFLSVGEFESNGELFFTGTITDMTELKETQAQLFESSRLATLGEMGASVAHELKNSLMGILGPADSAEETLENQNPNLSLVKENLQKIIERAKKMQLLVEHIRTSSRSSKDETKGPISINDVIKDSLLLFMSQLKAMGIQVHLNLSSEEPKTFGVAVRLESVFQNLIANARDALGECVDKQDRRIRIASFMSFDDRQIIITIEDNAKGIPPEHLKKIFDPFFTTKSKEKGTGLGLSIVSGIIKDHEGTISVDSTLGVGTRFELQLPNYSKAVEVKAS